MRYAIIEFGKVANIVESGEAFAQQNGWIVAGDAGIGDFYDGEIFTPPPAPPPVVPQIVSRAQFILALLQIDLLDEVEAAIALADRATQINYQERLEFERGFPLIATMAAVLGKTDAEVDALFVLAATL